MILMIAAVFAIAGAIFLGVMERALSPDLGHFPCVNPFIRIVLRVYTVAIFVFGIYLFQKGFLTPDDHSGHGALLFYVFMMSLCHGALMYQVLRMKLPAGMWAWFQKRQDKAHRLASQGARGMATLMVAAEGGTAYEPGARQPVEV